MEKVKLLLNGLVRDQSTEILTKSKIRAVASRLNFSESKSNMILLAVSEIITNQLKFSIGAGIIQIWEHKKPNHCLDIFGYDMGPGIKNLSKAMTDGYSTSNTLGHGLGTIMRSSDLFEIYTKPEKKDKKDIWNGTAVWCRFYPDKKPGKFSNINAGIYIRALNDDIYNGDFITFELIHKNLTWLHIDGVGHGKNAHASGEIADKIAISKLSPEDIINTLNKNLYGKRMANGVSISLDNSGNFLYSGYGNVLIKILTPSSGTQKSVHLQNRTIGENYMEIKSYKETLDQGDLLMTLSDGISESFNLSHYPGLLSRHPQMIAYLLGNLFSRRNDDKSLFIAKYDKE
ncbi:MAG: SpoIIE family protein phosphatase [Desulfobacteraceae bacterium]|nr:SpoIIE family protein phosphatase [Desulfobacteraceae bacterium]MCB9494860.1 SpoIIE family protein phosphatase [Desulfobacteraceae bacterium]